MNIRTKVVVALLWIVSLAAVGVMAQSRGRGQAAEPEVIAGSNIGFRVDHYKGETPVGELVVKRDGKWIPVEFATLMKMTK